MINTPAGEELIALVKKYLEGNASTEEVMFLEKYYSYFDKEDSFTGSLSAEQREELKNKMSAAIGKQTQPASIISIHRRSWLRIAAAAAIIILLGAGTYFLFLDKGKKEIAKTNNTTPEKIDLPPGGNKAVLTLGDNRTIVLDSAQNGTLADQGNAKVLKLNDGQLAYNLVNEKPAEVVYNTVTTPRGGQYQLTLADGSKVWLNAASSIRFPTAFAGNERKVEITGEAYFEVVHDAEKPFHVTVNGVDVEDLGTHFNINAYSDEATINTTLLEGSVKVSSLITHYSSLITPGQQAQVNNHGQITIDKDADIEEVVAWKNGKFIFNGANAEGIMRQISRWYNVDVVYESDISKETFSGIVSRNENVSEVLKIMEEGGLKFKLEGKKILVFE